MSAGYDAAVISPTVPRDSDIEAFATALIDMAPVLHAWAICRIRGDLRRRVEIDDFVQEVSVRACHRRTDFDPMRGTFRQWLFGFANRVWLETLRELGRDPTGPLRRHGGDSRLSGIPDSVTSMSSRLSKDEVLRTCRQRIDELEDDERRLLAAIGIEGMTHAEAGLVLGISEATSRKRWQRLRDRLRDDVVLRLCAD